MDEEGFVLELLGLSLARKEHGEAIENLFARGLARLRAHGDFPKFLAAVRNVAPLSGGLALNAVAPGRRGTAEETEKTRAALGALRPWRKGPFLVGDASLDAEWRSDRKWARLEGIASPFEGRRVLDVGSGNGYYLLRLAGSGADFALGVEPSVLYTSQFLALSAAFRPERVAHLPLPLEDFHAAAPGFDTVLSMGVLYHRREPVDHLRLLGQHLRPGGEVVVETLTWEESSARVLRPIDRYAMMRNVFAIPSPAALVEWLAEAGFEEIELSRAVPTTAHEQRRTEFSEGPSLLDFLDAEDPTRTIEGYPAPVRRFARGRKRL